MLNDPVNGIDPEGLIFETAWDLANVAMDLSSLGANLAAGNYGSAALDAAALGADLAATAVPGVPGGAGAACKAVRGGSSLWSSRKGKTAVENAFGHWQKHGAEFPEYQNAKQYVEGASNFFNNPPPGTLMKSGPNGNTLFYNPANNTFGVQAANGAPRTLFRPTAGINYWNAQ